MNTELENRVAVELVKNLRGVMGVVADPAEDKLFVVSYPKQKVAPLRGLKKDLKRAIELDLLTKGRTIKICGQECQIYMKTLKAARTLFGESDV